MCVEVTKKTPELVQVQEAHLDIINGIYPGSEGVHTELFVEAKKYHISILLFASLVVEHQCLKNRKFGARASENIVAMPLVVVDKNGKRYQTALMKSLDHASSTSFSSELFKKKINDVFKKYGYRFFTECNCTDCIGPIDDVERYFGSELHCEREEKHSGVGAQVDNSIIDIDDLSSVGPNTSISENGVEIAMYEDLKRILRACASVGFGEKQSFSLNHLVAKAGYLKVA